MERYTHAGLTFEVNDTGPAGGRVVLLLHGFPEDRYCWDRVAVLLAAAGYRVLAPDQRGYSPGARPPARRSYTVDLLGADALALAAAAGADRFDVVGHDWGAVVAWHLGAAHPDRVRSLTALSAPPPVAMRDALTRSSQALRSWYMLLFQLPKLPELLLSLGGGARMAEQLQRQGLDPVSARRYATRAARPQDLTGPLNWYRALPFEPRGASAPVAVPSLFVWGDRDPFVTRAAAERSARYVAAPFRFVALRGANHWLPSGFAGEVAPLLLEHLADIPAS